LKSCGRGARPWDEFCLDSQHVESRDFSLRAGEYESRCTNLPFSWAQNYGQLGLETVDIVEGSLPEMGCSSIRMQESARWREGIPPCVGSSIATLTGAPNTVFFFGAFNLGIKVLELPT